MQGLRRMGGHAGLAEKYFHFLEKYFAFYLHSILKPLTFVRSIRRTHNSYHFQKFAIMNFAEKISAAAELNPTVNAFVRQNGVVKQSFTLVKDYEKEGNFYLQGRNAPSQPIPVFAAILEGATAKGFEVEILGQPYDGKISENHQF